MTGHGDLSEELIGRRLELIYTDDAWTLLRPGATGTVTGVYAPMRQIHVQWDDGSTLSLIDGHDRYRLL